MYRTRARVSEVSRNPTSEHSSAVSPLLQPTQPLIAFRTWRVRDGELCSPYDGAVWCNATLSAQCRPRNAEDFARGDHAAPSPSCGCGISATAGPDLNACCVDASSVVGVVRLWGRVVLQSGSLRAEHAEVVMLGAYLQWSRRQRVAAAQVAERIGCRLVPLETLEQDAVETLGRQAVELDEATLAALHGAAPALVQVPGPGRRFVHVR
jgi:hypothetical protein